MTPIVTPDGNESGHSVRLSGVLPKGAATNGLRDHAAELIESPGQMRFGLVAFDTSRVITDVESGTDTAVVKIARIELADGPLEDAAKKLLLRAVKQRTGQDTLDVADEGDDD